MMKLWSGAPVSMVDAVLLGVIRASYRMGTLLIVGIVLGLSWTAPLPSPQHDSIPIQILP